MKNLFLVSIMIFFSLAANAQEKLDSTRNYTLKLPLSYLAGDIFGESMGIGIGVEKMLIKGLSVSQEIGYIFHVNHHSFLAEDLETINGIKFTTEIRKYLNRREIPVSGFFANLEMKNYITKSTEEYWTPERTREENDITRYRGVLTANFGVLFYWDKYKKSRITLELLAGGGLRYLNANSSVDPEKLHFKSEYNSGEGFDPCLNVDLKIGYVLR